MAVITGIAIYLPGKGYVQTFISRNFPISQPLQTATITLTPISVKPPPQTTTIPPTKPANLVANSTTQPKVSLTPTTTVIPTATPTGGGKGRIAFVSNRTGTLQIWSMNVDGSNQIQITSLVNGACQPAFSPDGTRLAVISPCSEKRLIYNDAQIFIMSSDGSAPFPLPIAAGGDFDPAWSHDSTRLAFSSFRSGNNPHIFLYNFTNSNLEELSDSRYADINPTWNIGDKQLAFSRLEKVAYHIFTMSDKGVTQAQISSNGDINDYQTDWSHDGEFIIFSRSPNDTNIPSLYRLDYKDRGTGAEVHILPANNTIPVIGARLSYDDKWITFESWPDGRNHDVYIMDIQGNNYLRLTNDPGLDFSPVWVPLGANTPR